jgi:glycosyltransferase involved in cell wall biosynthesis
MRKKILYIHHGTGIGGAPNSLMLLIKYLNKDKFFPVILLINEGPVRSFFESNGIQVLLFTKRMYPFHGTTVSGMTIKRFVKSIVQYTLTLIRAYRILKKIDYDILHLNTTCLFAFAQISKFIKPTIPVVSHIREPLLPNFFGNILRFFNKRNVDHFIAITKFDARAFGSILINTSIVYNCSDINQKVSHVKIGQSNKLTCLFLSRVSPENGTEILIDAAKSIFELHPNFNITFIIYGYPKLPDLYAQNLKSTNLPNVIFKDITDDISSAFTTIDIQISPYSQPHFSRAVIESALLGIPSIISDVGALTEEVIDGKTGLIFRHNDSNDLVKKILLLYHNRNLLSKMGLDAIKFANENFSVNNCQNMIEKIYFKL